MSLFHGKSMTLSLMTNDFHWYLWCYILTLPELKIFTVAKIVCDSKMNDHYWYTSYFDNYSHICCFWKAKEHFSQIKHKNNKDEDIHQNSWNNLLKLLLINLNICSCPFHTDTFKKKLKLTLLAFSSINGHMN